MWRGIPSNCWSGWQRERRRILLLHIPRLEQVDLEVKKPWAPVGLPLETVSVEITRGWHTAYVALGSNLGDREAYLNSAVQALGETHGCRIERVSSFRQTAPYGYTDQGEFLNGCLQLRTLLSPPALLARLHEIEQAAGRERKIHWGPRERPGFAIIPFYDQEILDLPELTIPHRDMQNRDFVLFSAGGDCPLGAASGFGKNRPGVGRSVAEPGGRTL